jgi:hypothetical protein
LILDYAGRLASRAKEPLTLSGYTVVTADTKSQAADALSTCADLFAFILVHSDQADVATKLKEIFPQIPVFVFGDQITRDADRPRTRELKYSWLSSLRSFP